MQSATQSTCCSIDTIMFESTDGLPGPGDGEQVREPGGRDAEVRARARPPTCPGASRRPAPAMSMRSSGPVMASNPVANTIDVDVELVVAGADAGRR